MKIAIASDLSGFPLKEALVAHLKSKGYDVLDFGIEDANHPQPYYIQAPKVAKAILEKKPKKEFWSAAPARNGDRRQQA